MSLEDVVTYVNNLYSAVTSKIRALSREGRVKKLYIQTLSEYQSFLALARKFLTLALCIAKAKNDLPGRLCHRWIYTKQNGYVSLTKLEPRIVISYDGTSFKVSVRDREIKASGLNIELRINQYRETADLSSEEDTLQKRSLIIEAIGSVKAVLDHVTPDMELCIKELRLRC